VLATGTVIADGILGPGLSHLQGEKILAEATSRSAELRLDPAYTGYTCNAAIRAAPVIAQGIRFDEKLPLYSWLEDVDFSARFRPFGRFVRSTAMRGVHLGTKTGRTPGIFADSQPRVHAAKGYHSLAARTQIDDPQHRVEPAWDDAPAATPMGLLSRAADRQHQGVG